MTKAFEKQDVTEMTDKTAVTHAVVGEDHAGSRLDRFLTRQYPGLPRTRLYRIVRKGEVRVNGKRAEIDTRLMLGDSVRLPPVRATAPEPGQGEPGRGETGQGEPGVTATAAAAPREAGAAPASPAAPREAAAAPAAPAAPRTAGAFAPAAGRRRVPDTLIQTVTGAIIHEDERLLVIDKPAGIAVHGGSGVSFGIIEALRAARPHESDFLELVHRLDRDTSGVLLVARKPAVLRMLHASLREGEGFEKRYLTLLKGSWQLGKKRIDAPLRTDLRVGGERTVKVVPMGKSAASDFRVVQSFGKVATLMEVSILTGRTHQIRVHAAYAGHPVAGDPKYGDAEFNEEMRDLELERMFLHASSLSFVWPDRGTDFSVNAPLPPALARVIDVLSRPRPKRTRYRYKR